MQGIDHDRVSTWLAEHVDGATPPFRFDLITGGRSNLTFLVTDGAGTRFVLRRPPTGHVLATAHDMAREHRLITAVGRTNVPVPRTLAFSSLAFPPALKERLMDLCQPGTDSLELAGVVSLELAESLGVVRHTIETFSVGGYRYTNLADAVAQARQMNEPDRTDG